MNGRPSIIPETTTCNSQQRLLCLVTFLLVFWQLLRLLTHLVCLLPVAFLYLMGLHAQLYYCL
jgi:hypothetical protein